MLRILHDLPQTPATHIPDRKDRPLTHRLVLEGFLRREELAQEFGLSPRTIDRWEALRKGGLRVCIGRTILYNVDSVREWLQSRERQAVPVMRRRSRFSALKS